MTELTQQDVNHRELVSALQSELLAAAREAQAAAYAPYSNFAVGAAVLLSDGTIYRGCNVENASFGLTVCAERVAIFSAVSDGRMDIAAIAVVTGAPKLCKPCGACRQVIAEFSQSDNPIMILSSIAGETALESITDLLQIRSICFSAYVGGVEERPQRGQVHSDTGLGASRLGRFKDVAA